MPKTLPLGDSKHRELETEGYVRRRLDQKATGSGFDSPRVHKEIYGHLRVAVVVNEVV